MHVHVACGACGHLRDWQVEHLVVTFFLLDFTFQLFQQNDSVVTFFGCKSSKSLQKVAKQASEL